MADIDINSALSGVATQGYEWLIPVLIAIGLFVVIAFLLWYKSYNKIVHLKVWTNNSSFYYSDKAKEIQKDGVIYWKFWKLKDLASVPPPKSIYISNNGTRVAEGYYTKDTGVLWATDTTTREKIIEKIHELEDHPDKKRKIIEGAFQPLTTQERAMLADQTIRAIKRRGQNLLETISQFATPLMMFVFVVLVLIFWGDIAKPVQELQHSNAEIAKQNAEISQQNSRLLVTLLGPNANITVKQNILGDAGGVS